MSKKDIGLTTPTFSGTGWNLDPELDNTDLYSARIRLPSVWREVLKAQGIDVSEFARDAMEREFKRRKIDVPAVPEIKPGRPRTNNSDEPSG